MDGDRQYIVKVTRDISNTGELLVIADSAAASTDGALVFINHDGNMKYQGVVIPPGSWKIAYVLDLIENRELIEEVEE